MGTANKKVQVVDTTTEFEKNLKVVEEPVPTPQENEVLVRVLLRPVNPSDVFGLRGPRLGPGAELPFTPGLEGMGVVAEVGKGVTKLVKGQRVIGMPWPTRSNGQGTWQQYVSVPESNLIPVPDGIADEAAAMFLVNPCTAFGMLDDLDIPTDKYVLQTAAGSVLGRMFIALARRKGVKTINIVRRSAQKEELLALGADVVIATDNEDVLERVLEITGGEGAYAAIECVGGEFTGTVVKAVREEGRIFLYGALSGPTATIGIVDLLYKARRLEGWVLGNYMKRQGDDLQFKLGVVWDLIKEGAIQFYTGNRYPLDEVVEAVNESLREARGGKVLLEG